MKTFLSYLRNKVELYKGDNLFEEREIEKQIHKIFESKVYLKSKAYLVIEPTEGLVVIDVNSGGFRKKFSQEESGKFVNGILDKINHTEKPKNPKDHDPSVA